MRLVADQIRGLDVNKALVLLKHSSKAASLRLEKVLLSAIANFKLSTQIQQLKLLSKIFLLTLVEC